MDRRAEINLRKEEARGSHAGLYKGTGDLQQQVRQYTSSTTTTTTER